MLTRMLLPRSRYDEGIAIMEEGFRNVPYGDPTDPANFQGPQISALPARPGPRLHRARAGREGARVVVGGGRPAHLTKGYYVEPTLFADVDNSMTIAQEEIFGPVLVVVPFEDDDDAVRIANDNQYGLGVRRHLGLRGAGHGRGPADPGRVRPASTAASGTAPTPPSADTRPAASAARTAIEGFEQYTETKTIAGPLPAEADEDAPAEHLRPGQTEEDWNARWT